MLLTFKSILNLRTLYNQAYNRDASENYNNIRVHSTRHLITTSYLPPPLSEGFFLSNYRKLTLLRYAQQAQLYAQSVLLQ